MSTVDFAAMNLVVNAPVCWQNSEQYETLRKEMGQSLIELYLYKKKRRKTVLE